MEDPYAATTAWHLLLMMVTSLKGHEMAGPFARSEKCQKDGGGLYKRQKNVSNSEVKVQQQEVSDKRHIIFNSVSGGYKAVNKTNAWNAITHAVNAVSGEGRRTDEVKNKWSNFNLNSEAKKHISKHSLEDS